MKGVPQDRCRLCDSPKDLLPLERGWEVFGLLVVTAPRDDLSVNSGARVCEECYLQATHRRFLLQICPRCGKKTKVGRGILWHPEKPEYHQCPIQRGIASGQLAFPFLGENE